MLRRCGFRLCQVKAPATVVTHQVLNQATILEDFNLYASNRRMQECVAKYHGEGAAGVEKDTSTLLAYGAYCGSADAMNDAYLANSNLPVFTPFDRQGRRIDSVTFHESYHRLMASGMQNGIPSLAYQRPKGKGQIPRCALNYMHYQLEQGTSCPLTMTYAGVPVLQQSNENGFFDDWIAKLTTPEYDSRDIHISLKRAAMCGMSMTEKQGGSDVRSNTTTATPLSSSGSESQPGAAFVLRGHKWFTSAPMCDAFLTLAQTKEGISCFLVPRWISPTERNLGLRFQRLKNKLGDRSNASSEVEYHDAVGFLLGKLGRGVPTIIEMVNYTRLDCLLGSSALVQAALFQAVNHVSTRSAFGGVLVQKPLMRNVLCDLALEAEANTALAMRVAHCFDCGKEREVFRRIAVAIGKYFVCKRAPSLVYEALECMGGNGYVEDFPMARFYRQSPLNAIWEGSGNVIVLDVFRAVSKDPSTVAAIIQEVRSTEHPVLIATLNDVLSLMRGGDQDAVESQGRVVVETLATLLQAAALFHSNKSIGFEEFVASRFPKSDNGAARRSRLVGTLPYECISKELIERHVPVK
jgi:putative acyl-CoA dehydrogenase